MSALTTIDEHDNTITCIYWESKEQYTRYRHTAERCVFADNKQCQTIKHIIGKGNILKKEREK